MQALAWVFYLIFAAIIAFMYLAIRRQWFSPGVVATVGTLGSIISMVMTSLAQGNNLLHAVVMGILVGAVFSSVTLGAAWYFHSSHPTPRREEEPG